ncbi:venom acid phosphatase Acph-1-like isoform X2 [Copidosoma floridanum]|uniref:venom acid phosphatase Acph-1-like isoform X2 n=1 Tax=Copidosoma floridanum TaxID=29053 RepID=UPI0006C9C01B|nr:venom acid phosphatase Acph-1-like isoform X2 [Copidosoma floridanum]
MALFSHSRGVCVSIVCFFLLKTGEMSTAKDFKLELVQVLFRHGARTCSESEAKLPMPAYVDQELHRALGYGQLTNVGKAQAYELGRALRERYDGFLGPRYRPEELHARSTDYDRTKMTLQLVLAGLYPLRAEQNWSADLAWMPIPFHYAPRELDVLLQSSEKPRYKRLLHDLLKSPGLREQVAELMKFSEFFESKGIVAIKEYAFVACLGIFNVLNVHKSAGARLPDWYTEDLFAQLLEKVIEYFDIKSATGELMKLGAGPLIKQFVRNMNLTGESSNPRKIYLYSGHEMNIAPFTRAHGIREFRYPDFANAVVLEKLRDSENKIYVRGGFTPLKLGSFDEYCPVNEYLTIIENIIPTDEEVDAMFNDRKLELKEIFVSDFAFRPKYKQ